MESAVPASASKQGRSLVAGCERWKNESPTEEPSQRRQSYMFLSQERSRRPAGEAQVFESVQLGQRESCLLPITKTYVLEHRQLCL